MSIILSKCSNDSWQAVWGVFLPRCPESFLFRNSKFHVNSKLLLPFFVRRKVCCFAHVKLLCHIIAQLQHIVSRIANVEELVGVFCSFFQEIPRILLFRSLTWGIIHKYGLPLSRLQLFPRFRTIVLHILERIKGIRYFIAQNATVFLPLLTVRRKIFPFLHVHIPCGFVFSFFLRCPFLIAHIGYQFISSSFWISGTSLRIRCVNIIQRGDHGATAGSQTGFLLLHHELLRLHLLHLPFLQQLADGHGAQQIRKLPVDFIEILFANRIEFR